MKECLYFEADLMSCWIRMSDGVVTVVFPCGCRQESTPDGDVIIDRCELSAKALDTP